MNRRRGRRDWRWKPEHDLTVIGATREGLLQRVLFGAISEAVGQRTQSTAIMIKSFLGVTSRLAWLFNRIGSDQR